MRTKLLLKAKKFFSETFGTGKFPEKDEMYSTMIQSSFVPKDAKIMFSIFFTKEVFEEFLHTKLEPFSTNPNQIEILKILYFSKDSQVIQEDITRYTFASKASISSQLSKLEKRGFIKRKENPENKRQKLVQLTHEGEDFLFEVSEHWNPFKLRGLLSSQETKTFLELISKVQKNFKEYSKKEQ
jgi:DNA-binding MarR family transcriptional regulator